MQGKERVAVQVVLVGHVPRMPDALASLERQESREFCTVVADHGATDGVRGWLIPRPDLVVLRRPTGKDVLRGHNDLLAMTRSRWQGEAADNRFVLFLGQDVWLDAEAIGQLLKAFDADPSLDLAGPVLVEGEWRFDEDEERAELIPSGRWHSAGWSFSRSRRVRLRAHGLPDTESLSADEVFGFPLLALMVRVSALDRLKTSVGWLDEVLGSEDLAGADLAWRAKLMGMRSMVVPEARGWVRPTLPDPVGLWPRLKLWFGSEARGRRVTCSGWLLIRLKNDYVWSALVHLPWTLVEWGKGILSGLLDPATGARSLGVLSRIPRALRLRREFRPRTTQGADEMWRWFV